MASSSPWDVGAANNVVNGYTKATSVTCSNGAMTVTYSDWTIKLTVNIDVEFVINLRSGYNYIEIYKVSTTTTGSPNETVWYNSIMEP